MSWTEDRVRNMLLEVAGIARQRGGHMLGSQVGQALGRLDETFEAHALGDESLAVLLGRFEDILTLLPRSPEDSDLTFRFTDVEERTGHSRIHPDMWRAMVVPSLNAVHYVDLAETNVVSIGEEGLSSLVTEPERYLQIPRVPYETVTTPLREWVERHATESDQIRLLEHLESQDWYQPFANTCAELELRGWRTVQYRAVLSHLREWLEQHDIRESTFILWPTQEHSQTRPKDKRARRHSAPGRTPNTMGHSNVRARVIAAVERMSDDELLSLRIPVRYLLD